MTRTIQFWMIINLVQIIPKVDDKNHPILDDYKFSTKVDDQNHPIFDEYEFGTDYSKKWMNRTIHFWNLIVDFCHYIGNELFPSNIG